MLLPRGFRWFRRESAYRGLAFVLGFDECFQVVEAGSPEDAVLLDPGVDRAERLRIELVNAVTPLAVLTDEVSPAKQAQVLRDRGTGDGKGSGNLTGGLAAPTEKVEDSAAGRIGEGLEGGFRVSGGGICNRSVTHDV